MSVVSYGDITLALVKTNGVSQVPIYTDDGADYLYTKYTVDVQCLFDPAVMSGGGTVVQLMRNARQSLLAPRKYFFMSIGGETFLDCTAPDEAAGPYPKMCEVQRINGSRSFVVHYVIEFHKRECVGAGDTPIISNRYETTQSYDENFFCTRETRGKLVVSGTKGTPGDLDQFRHLVMPKLPSTWKRDRCHFVVSSDGLTLAYSITDREIHGKVPYPGTSATGRYSETYEDYGTKCWIDYSVEVAGPPENSRKLLLQVAATIIADRIGATDQIVSTQINEFLWQNRIELSIRAIRVPQNAKVFDSKMILDNTFVGKDLPTQDLGPTPRDLHMRDGLLKAAVASWHQICESRSEGIANSTEFTQQSPGTLEIEEAAETDADAGSVEPIYTSDHQQDPYTDYQIDCIWEVDANTVQLPIADDVTSDSSGGSTNGYGKPSAVVRIAPNTQRLRVKWRAERMRKWPKGPSTDNLPDGFSLISNNIVLEEPALLPNGLDYRYTTRGETVFAVETSRDPQSDGITAAQVPYARDADTNVPTETWISSILFPEGNLESL